MENTKANGLKRSRANEDSGKTLNKKSKRNHTDDGKKVPGKKKLGGYSNDKLSEVDTSLKTVEKSVMKVHKKKGKVKTDNKSKDDEIEKVSNEKGKKETKKVVVKSELESLDDMFSNATKVRKEIKVKRKKAQDKAELAREREIQARLEDRLEEQRLDPKPIRFDKELGLPIYSEESLRINQGGDTADCPFDCNCCF